MKYLRFLSIMTSFMALLFISNCRKEVIMPNCGFSVIPQAPEGWEVVKLNENRFDGTPYDFHMVSNEVGYLLMSAHYTADPEILKTTDGGIEWFSVFTASSHKRPREIFFLTSEIGFVSFGYEGNGTLLKTIDGGDNWVEIEMDKVNGYFRDMQVSSLGDLFAIHFKDRESSQLVKSIDGGLTWRVIFDSDLLLNEEIDLNMKLTDDQIYIAGKSGSLIVVDLEGQLLKNISIGDQYVTNFVVLDEDNISISTWNKLIKTDNGGTSWSEIHNGKSDVIDYRRNGELLAIINKSCCFDQDVCYPNDAISIFNSDLDVWTEGETIQSSLSNVKSVVKISESHYKLLIIEQIYDLNKK